MCDHVKPILRKKSGVVQLSISDHALVYMTRKARYDRCGARIIQARCMKSFNESTRKGYVTLATHGRVALIIRMNGSDRI